jgi:hypothetical protein
MNNKKAQIVSLLTFIIAGIVIVTFFAAWIYFFNSMTGIMHNIPSSTQQANISSAVSKVIDPVNNAMNGLNLISVAILIGLILNIFIEAYYVRRHPILFVVYLMIVILAVVSSVYVANQYESLMSNALLGSLITANTGGSFIILNLPIMATIIGFFGLIIMFIAINRDPEYNRGSSI